MYSNCTSNFAQSGVTLGPPWTLIFSLYQQTCPKRGHFGPTVVPNCACNMHIYHLKLKPKRHPALPCTHTQNTTLIPCSLTYSPAPAYLRMLSSRTQTRKPHRSLQSGAKEASNGVCRKKRPKSDVNLQKSARTTSVAQSGDTTDVRARSTHTAKTVWRIGPEAPAHH